MGESQKKTSLEKILGTPTEDELIEAQTRILQAMSKQPHKKPNTSKKEFMDRERQNKLLADKKFHKTGYQHYDIEKLNETQIRKHPSMQDSYEQKAKTQKHLKNMTEHNTGIKEIVEWPEMIGIKEKIIGIAYPMQNQDINRFDVLLEGRDTRFIIKYTATDSAKKRKLAKHQLIETKEKMNEKYKEKPTKMIYVSGIGYESQILTKDGFKPLNYTPIK